MERLAENCKWAQSIAPASRTVGAVNGSGVDTRGFDHATLEVQVGAIGNTGTDTTLAVKLQESNDDGVADAYADIAGAAIVTLAYTDDNKICTVDVRMGGRANRKRYLRAVGTVAGSDAAIYGAAILLTNPEKAPVVNSPVSVVVA